MGNDLFFGLKIVVAAKTICEDIEHVALGEPVHLHDAFHVGSRTVNVDGSLQYSDEPANEIATVANLEKQIFKGIVSAIETDCGEVSVSVPVTGHYVNASINFALV